MNALRRTRKGLVLVAAVTAGVLALGLTNSGAAVVKSTKAFGSGSDVTYKVQAALDTAYNQSPGCNTTVLAPAVQPLDFSCVADTESTIKSENYAHDVISQAYPVGASFGIQQLCGNLAGVSFARNTRAYSSSDCTGLRTVAYARDGIAWQCFNSCHGVTNLTKAQLQGIFGDCSITNWSQVGGTPGPIKVYAIRPGSGIKKNFTSYLGIADEAPCASGSDHIIFQNNNAPILANGDQDDSIFYMSIGAHKTNTGDGADGSVLGSLEGKAPIENNVEDGTYPLGYFLSNVYCQSTTGAAPCPKKAANAVTNYLGPVKGWICKAAATGDPKRLHAVDAATGLNFRTLIENTIRDYGFAPIKLGPTGGGVTGNSYCRVFDRL